MLTEFGPDVQSLTLYPGGGGVFDVRVEDDLVFSKHQYGRFPSNEEVASEVRKRLKG